MSVAEARCGACGEELAARQRWCLCCGAAARTVIAATPRWVARSAAATAVSLLALAGIGYALAALASS
jgi:hypothetical protein